MSQTATSSSNYLLVVTHENGGTTQHPLEAGRSVVLGSSPHCGVQVRGKDVASMHCLIDLNDGVLGIQDWASSGTIVNGSAIAAKMSISEDDQVQIGGATIRVQNSASTAPKQQDEAIVQHVSDEVLDEVSPLDESACEESETVDQAELVEAIQVDELVEAIQVDEPLDIVDSQIEELIELDDPIDVPLPADPYDWNSDVDEADSQAALEWDAGGEFDAETVQLLKDEIEDLRSMLAERDLQVEELSRINEFTAADCRGNSLDHEANSLQQRVEELLAEASDNDERFQILHDLLQAAELKNQAECEERQSLETWVAEIEHRIGQRESEWKAEIEAVREQLTATEQERNQLQHKLREVASRFGAQDVYRETLDKLQTRTAALQEQLAKTQRQAVNYKQQLENAQNRESDVVQQERALIAKERASVSRMRHELSRKLNEFEETTEPKNTADREVALRLRTLRSHLREIHEQEQQEREQKGESLLTRISGLWKRMDDEY